jgi:hypothetical protein
MMKFWINQKPDHWEIWCGSVKWASHTETEAETWAEMLFLLRVHTLDLSDWMDAESRMYLWGWD